MNEKLLEVIVSAHCFVLDSANYPPVGVDEYVPKFEAQKLSETLTRRLMGSVPVVRPD